MTIREILNDLDIYCLDEDLHFYDFKSLYEGMEKPLTDDQKKRINDVAQKIKSGSADAKTMEDTLTSIRIENDPALKNVVDKKLNEDADSLQSRIFDFLDDLGGYADYNQRIEDVSDEFNMSPDEAENYVWNWCLNTEAEWSDTADQEESLQEKLVDAPQEVIDELVEILDKHGFILDPEFDENPSRSLIFGDVHLQVINPDSFIDTSDEVEVQNKLKEYVSRDLINEIHELDKRTDCPITWNFGPNKEGQVTGGLDIMKQWVPDDEEDIEESIKTKRINYCPHCSNNTLVEIEDGYYVCDECGAEYTGYPAFEGGLELTPVEDECLSEDLDISSYQRLSSTLKDGGDTYALFRKIEDGKGKWAAAKFINGEADLDNAFEITYEQARGFEPVSNIGKVSKNLGKKLFPKNESLDDDIPYTYEQMERELKSATNNWTKDNFEGYVGYVEEFDAAIDILSHHYENVEKIGFVGQNGEYGFFATRPSIYENLNESSELTDEDWEDFYKLEEEIANVMHGINSDLDDAQANIYHDDYDGTRRLTFRFICGVDKISEKIRKQIINALENYLNKTKFNQFIYIRLYPVRVPVGASYEVIINAETEPTENLNEASYGGAYDIEDDMFFTKEEIVEFVDDVIAELSAEFGKNYFIEEVGFVDPTNLYISIEDTGGYAHSHTFHIDMRRIKLPKDIYKYKPFVLGVFKSKFGDDYEYEQLVSESMNEDTVKQNGKWVNKGDSGETHGKFATKKAADAQRRAMFANGFKEDLSEQQKNSPKRYVYEICDKLGWNPPMFIDAVAGGYRLRYREDSKEEAQETIDMVKQAASELGIKVKKALIKPANQLRPNDDWKEYEGPTKDNYTYPPDSDPIFINTSPDWDSEEYKKWKNDNYHWTYYAYMVIPRYEEEDFEEDYHDEVKISSDTIERWKKQPKKYAKEILDAADISEEDEKGWALDSYNDSGAADRAGWPFEITSDIEADYEKAAMNWWYKSSHYRDFLRAAIDDWIPKEKIQMEEAYKHLNNREKQVYVDIINNPEECEDIDDLKDIVHEIFFYDKALFAMMNKFPKDASFEELKANKIAILKDSMLDESLNEDLIISPEKEYQSKSGHRILIKDVTPYMSEYDGTANLRIKYDYKLAGSDEWGSSECNQYDLFKMLNEDWNIEDQIDAPETIGKLNPGDKFKNRNGVEITIIEPQKDGTVQFKIGDEVRSGSEKSIQRMLYRNNYLREDYERNDDSWGEPYSFDEVERELKKLTNNWSDEDGTIRCYYEQEKQYGMQILKKHYDIVEPSDGRTGPGEEMSWVLAYSKPKEKLDESLNESRTSNLQDKIIDCLDWFIMMEMEFPKNEFLADSWEDVKNGIQMGIDPEFEVAEGIVEYLKPIITFNKKYNKEVGEEGVFQDEIDMYKDLVRAMNDYLVKNGYEPNIKE